MSRLSRLPDFESWSVSAPRRLTFGAGDEALPSGSRDGKIAFVNIHQRRDIWSLQLDPATGEAVGKPVRLTAAESNDTAADVTADSRRIAYISNRWGGQDLWTTDLTTGKETNLSNDAALQLFPVLTADGERIAYATRERRKFAVYARPFGGGIGRLLCDDCGPPRSWSPDDRYLSWMSANAPPRKPDRRGAIICPMGHPPAPAERGTLESRWCTLCEPDVQIGNSGCERCARVSGNSRPGNVAASAHAGVRANNAPLPYVGSVVIYISRIWI